MKNENENLQRFFIFVVVALVVVALVVVLERQSDSIFSRCKKSNNFNKRILSFTLVQSRVIPRKLLGLGSK